MVKPTGLSNRERQICQRVRQARERSEPRLSQEEVAVKLGLTKAGYGHYEREAQPFSVDQLFKLSTILRKPISWFLGISSELSEEEDELLHLWRNAGEYQRKVVRAILKEVGDK